MRKMSNSKLVSYTRWSPNCSKPRRGKITKITPHIIAGNISLQSLGNIFANKNRKASSTYGIDSQGRVGQYVDEKNRPWTSSSASNDNQAVTVEIANSTIGGDWKISDKALEAFINLSVDVCRRNGMKKVVYTGNSKGTLTRHNMFSNTVCPGRYLTSKLPYIEKEVNRRLSGGKVTSKPKTPSTASKSKKLVVDGLWGKSTTMEMQRQLGTPVDGVISGQYSNSVTRAIYGTSFISNRGSSVIRAFQKKVGAKVDGHIGRGTIRAAQRYYRTPVDGVISRPSILVKEIQRRLNNNTF